MDTPILIVLGILGFGINLLVIYFVIQAATKSSEKIKFMKVQIKLLIKIAQANGVTEDSIEEVIKPRRK